jgi:hypothetical protein
MFLFGQAGQQLDGEKILQDIDTMRQTMKNSFSLSECVDREQDAKIEMLASENTTLKLCLATLIKLLVSKQVLTTEEIRALVKGLDKPQTADS